MNYFYILNQYFLRVAFSTYFNTRVFGRENVPVKGPVLLISNHQSFLDPMLCGFGLNRELDYMARDTLFDKKILEGDCFLGWEYYCNKEKFNGMQPHLMAMAERLMDSNAFIFICSLPKE